MPEDTLFHPLDNQPPVKSSKKWLKRLGISLLVLVFVALLFAGVGYLALVGPTREVVSSIKQLQLRSATVADAAKAQDLPEVSNQLSLLEKDLQTVGQKYSRLSWLKIVPFVSGFYRDGLHGLDAATHVLQAGKITVSAIAPYADLVGLKGLATTGDGAKTAQDRINFIIETLDKVKPQLGQIGSELASARTAVDQIKLTRYPITFRGVSIRPRLASAVSLLDQGAALVTDAQPLLESAPYILGKDSPRKYLVLFQNDAELRPTGGFMTAYSVIEVTKGKISIIQSNDIYTLDEKFPKKIPAPEPIKKYLPNVAYWYLRDQNLSPDFKASMETFYPNYQLTKSPEVDGIIAVDTQLLVDLLKLTGPIGVPGFGNYSAENDKRCNCPQVFYELEMFADQEGPVVWDPAGTGKIIFGPRNYGNRKSFIGPMMHSVLANVMAQPKRKMSELFSTLTSAINGKHIQLYFTNPATQKAVESFNLAGRVRDHPQDYLMVVDTNFAGAKTNAWVTYSADQKIEVSGDGTVTKTLTLTYKNPQQYFQDPKTTLKLNGVFRDWLRIYVPKGSQLIEAKGFETGQTTGEDLGKTVFEGFFTLTPLNVKTITIKYKLPLKMSSPYKILIQKQGGSKDFFYKTTLNGHALDELTLSSDRELSWPY